MNVRNMSFAEQEKGYWRRNNTLWACASLLTVVSLVSVSAIHRVAENVFFSLLKIPLYLMEDH